MLALAGAIGISEEKPFVARSINQVTNTNAEVKNWHPGRFKENSRRSPAPRGHQNIDHRIEKAWKVRRPYRQSRSCKRFPPRITALEIGLFWKTTWPFPRRTQSAKPRV